MAFDNNEWDESPSLALYALAVTLFDGTNIHIKTQKTNTKANRKANKDQNIEVGKYKNIKNFYLLILTPIR